MTTDDILNCSDNLARLNTGARTMEAVAQNVVFHLYANLSDAAGTHSCILARIYKTHTYGDLPSALKSFVDRALGDVAPRDELKCLTLLATHGDEPDWNERTKSLGHQAIPLMDAASIRNIPMVARLVEQFGIDTHVILDPDPDLMVDLSQRKYQVFHVPEAEGNPYIPAQKDFVLRYGVRSVVGFGGLLPSGELFAVILFCREPINRSLAEDFSLLVLPIKIALLPFVFGEIFDPAVL